LKSIGIVDRSVMIDRLQSSLTRNPRHTGIVTIDMHRAISIRKSPPCRQSPTTKHALSLRDGRPATEPAVPIGPC
jgi:hypothetical protein